jgi:ATP-dependent RNA helicase RhlE
VNFELPGAPEDYVHRIGRTGRAGASGEAISLVCAEEHERLEAIEKMVRISIPRKIIPGFEPDLSVVPSIMGPAGRRRDAPGRERRPRASIQGRERAARSGQGLKNVDPIFSSPYQPGQAAPAPRETPSASRAPRQLAVLLGGLPKTHK